MQDIIINGFINFPAELATFLMAMVPVTELRASIPVAIISYKMAPFWAFFWSVLGNTLMGIIVVLILEPVTKLIIKRVDFLNNFWEKYIERIRRKNEKKFERWGAVALITFVAIPLPMTGAFTGGVAASIFQIPVKIAGVLLLVGCIISGAIVTGVTLGFNGL